MANYSLDKYDKEILKILQKNNLLTFKEIGEHVNLTLTPVHERIKKLTKLGVIENNVALLNKEALGLKLLVCSQITLSTQNKESSQNFNHKIKSLPEVLECYFVSGSFDYLLKIIVNDMEHYHQFHQEKLSVIKEVSLINSFFVMSQIKQTTQLPIF